MSLSSITPRYRLVPLPNRSDDRGALVFAQQGDQIPFEVRRIFFLYDVAQGATRGGHAHFRQHQFLIMMSGTCTLIVDDGSKYNSIKLSLGSEAVYVPPMLWVELADFSENSICCVLASGRYDEGDYIRDYERFRALVRYDQCGD